MNSEPLIEQLASLLEVTPDVLTIDTRLNKFDTWDSLTKISVLAVVHEHYGVTIEGESLEQVATVGDLTDLVRKTLPASAP